MACDAPKQVLDLLIASHHGILQRGHSPDITGRGKLWREERERRSDVWNVKSDEMVFVFLLFFSFFE